MGWQQDRRWKTVRLRILARDGHLCQIRAPGCTGDATDVDHIVAPPAGGSRYDPSNLRAACGHCNRGHHGHEKGVSHPSREW
ncbi:MAG: HNH endonuclease [Actinomycetota bacterium]